MNQEQVWDSLAESWNNFRQKVYEKGLYHLNWKKGKLLEIGCGNCRNLKLFKGFDLYGIDFSSEMLKYAKKFSNKYSLNIKLKKADMIKIPFKENYFDYILNLASLHHLTKENADKSLKEIYRVLKKNGQCFISVWNKYPKFIFHKKETYIEWKQKDKIYQRYYYLYNSFELKKLLIRDNFKILKSGKFFDKNLTFLIQK